MRKSLPAQGGPAQAQGDPAHGTAPPGGHHSPRLRSGAGAPRAPRGLAPLWTLLTSEFRGYGTIVFD